MRSESSFYRSDWPEVGLPAPFGEGRLPPLPPSSGGAAEWVRETRVANLTVRWLAEQDMFESRVYGFPIWDLHVEAGIDGGGGAPQADSLALLREHIAVEADRLLGAPPSEAAFVCSKVVVGEPLHHALSRCGFEEIERRRLYKTLVRDMIPRPTLEFDRTIRFTTLAGIAPDRHAPYREQVLEICREAFGRRGYGRHFTEPFLVERLPGQAYIIAVMQLNFDRLTPADFFVAIHADADRVAGFSVVGGKAGLTKGTYAQLLSAVREGYRGRGLYGGLTHLLRHSLPRDASLLNVTHVDNREMQSAYDKSGRVQLADTVVMRRVFSAKQDRRWREGRIHLA